MKLTSDFIRISTGETLQLRHFDIDDWVPEQNMLVRILMNGFWKGKRFGAHLYILKKNLRSKRLPIEGAYTTTDENGTKTSTDEDDKEGLMNFLGNILSSKGIDEMKMILSEYSSWTQQDEKLYQQPLKKLERVGL